MHFIINWYRNNVRISSCSPNFISNCSFLISLYYCLQFVSLESGDERTRLTPVLNTMLKFTDEELSTLKTTAESGNCRDLFSFELSTPSARYAYTYRSSYH